jgi:hypothetical protein
MYSPCDYCSERYKDGDEIVEEVTLWKAPVGRLGTRAMEIEVSTGKWMHRPCALMRKQDGDQKPGQTALIP